MTDPVLLRIDDGIAVITLNTPQNKNAFDQSVYSLLTKYLRQVDQREDVYLTIVTGTGDFFSAGANVKSSRDNMQANDFRTADHASFIGLATGNLYIAQSLYQHSKILVAALPGPAIGIAAGLLGWFDFIYATDNTYVFTPFTTLSLVAEGGASYTFPLRMGLAKAKEALIMGKKLTAQELETNGFINKVFPKMPSDEFEKTVIDYLKEKFDGLDRQAIQVTKSLIHATLPDPAGANAREVAAGAARFATGLPLIEFAKFANKTKRHKL